MDVFKLLGSIGVETGGAEKSLTLVTKTAEETADKLSESFDKASEKTGRAFGKMPGPLKNAAAVIGSAVDRAGAAIGKAFSSASAKTDSAMTAIKAKAKETFDRIPAPAREAAAKIAQGFGKIGPPVAAAFNKVKSAADGAAEKIGTAFQGGVAKVKSAVGKIPGHISAAGPGIAAAAGAIGIGFSAALVKSIDIQTSTNKVAAQLGLTKGESGLIGKAAGELYAKGFGENYAAAAETVGAVLSSIRGVTTKNLGQLSEGVATIADTFGIEAGRVAQVAGQMLNTGLVKNAQKGVDLLAATLSRVPTNVRDDILDAADEYGPFFQQLGLTGEKAMGMLVAASAKGMYGIDKTGDAIKEFTIRATDGSKASTSALKAIGLDATKMSNDLLAGGQRGSKAFQTIVDGLLKIKDPTDRANTALALFGTPLEDLSVNEIPKFLKGLQGADQEFDSVDGAAKDMAATLKGGVAASWDSLVRSFGMAATSIADKLLPVIQPLAEWLSKNPEMIQSVVVGLGALVGIVGAVTAATALWNAVMAANPIVLVVAAIAALVAGLVYFFTQTETGKKLWADFTAWLKTTWDGFVSWFRSIMDGLVNWWNGLWGGFFSGARGIIDGFVSWWNGLWGGFGSGAQDGVNGFMDWWNGLWGGFGSGVADAWAGLTGAVSAGWNAVVSWVTGAVNGFLSWWGGIWSGLTSAVSGALSFVGRIVLNGWNAVQAIFSAAWEILQTIVATSLAVLIALFTGKWGEIGALIASAWNKIIGFIGGALTTVWTSISNVWNMVASVTSTVWNTITGFLTGVWNGLVSNVTTAWNLLSAATSAAWAAITGFLTSTWNNIRATVANTWNAILAFIRQTWNNILLSIRVLANAVASFLVGAWNNIRNTVTSVWNGIVGFIQSIPQRFLQGLAAVGRLWQNFQNWIGLVKGAVESKFNEVIGWITGIPGRIVSGLGDLGGLLINAGNQIMDGFKRGLEGAFKGVQDFVGGIGKWIADHKGPKAYDLALLVPAGKWIMQGLAKGLSLGMTKVSTEVGKVAGRINSEITKHLKRAGSLQAAGQKLLQRAANTSGVKMPKLGKDAKANAAKMQAYYAAIAKRNKNVQALIAQGQAKLREAARERTLVSALNKTSAYIANANKTLAKLTTQRAGLAAKLKDAQAKLTDAVKVRDKAAADAAEKFRSEFDLGDVVGRSANGIIAQAKRAVDGVKNFAGQLDQLRKLGLNADFIAQIGELGSAKGSQVAKSLIAGGKGAVGQLNTYWTQLGQVSKTAGDRLANGMYGAGIDSLKGLVNGITKNIGTVDKAMRQVTDRMIGQVKKNLGIRSPSRVAQGLSRFFMLGVDKGLDPSVIAGSLDAITAAMTNAVPQDVETRLSVAAPTTDEVLSYGTVGNVGVQHDLRVQNQTMATQLNTMTGVLQQILTALGVQPDTQIVLDSGALVGALAPKIDQKLGTINTRKDRGNK